MNLASGLAKTAAVATASLEKHKSSQTSDGTAPHPWWPETASLTK